MGTYRRVARICTHTIRLLCLSRLGRVEHLDAGSGPARWESARSAAHAHFPVGYTLCARGVCLPGGVCV